MANERLEYKLVVKDLASGALKEVSLNANQADRALGNASKSASSFSNTLSVFKGSLLAGAFQSIIGFAKQAGQAMWDLGTQNDFARASFTSMLNGNSKLADEHISKLREMAQTTPFETKDLIDASKTLQQFGVDVKTTIPLMRALGDASGGNAERFKSMALVMGQVTSAGKLQGQDLLQFINAGWNPLNEIAKKTGETMGQVRDRMSKGGVSAGEVAMALADATKEGGKFFGLMEAQSKTVGGKWSNFIDSIQLKLINFWNSNNSAFGSLIDGASNVVNWFTTNWGTIVEIFKPLTDTIYEMVSALADVYQKLGLVGTSGSILKSIFVNIGRVLQLLRPLLWVIKTVFIGIVGLIGDTVKLVMDLIDSLLKLFGITGKEFKFKEGKVQKVSKTDTLTETLKKGGGQEFLGIKNAVSGTSTSTNATKSARTSDIKNITINIGKMIEDLQIVTQSDARIVYAIEREVKKVIALAVNDFNALAN